MQNSIVEILRVAYTKAALLIFKGGIRLWNYQRLVGIQVEQTK